MRNIECIPWCTVLFDFFTSNVSKAAEKSQSSTPVKFFSSVFFAQSSWMSSHAVMVLLFGLKPCGFSGRRLFFLSCLTFDLGQLIPELLMQLVSSWLACSWIRIRGSLSSEWVSPLVTHQCFFPMLLSNDNDLYKTAF